MGSVVLTSGQCGTNQWAVSWQCGTDQWAVSGQCWTFTTQGPVFSCDVDKYWEQINKRVKQSIIRVQLPRNRTSECSIDISCGVVQPTCSTTKLYYK